MRSSTPRQRHVAAALLAAAMTALFPPARAEAPSAAPAWMPDYLFLRHGVARDARATVLGARWDLPWRCHWGERGVLTAYLEAAAGHWESDAGPVRSSAISTQAGLTPVARYSFHGDHGWYVEAGIGANVITPVYRSREKQFSTAFNFGDHAAVGWRSAGPQAWDWSLRLQHFSNAGIARPNPGEDFIQVQVARALR